MTSWKDYPLVFWKPSGQTASWTALSIDIKSKVVKEMDLLTRCRLKISSRSNQELVDSVPLTIKNARICLGDDACLLMVHTGIGKFVKLDLELIKGKVVIKRSINSRDVSKAKKISTAHKDPLVPLCLFAKSLLTNNISLNTLEWEYNPSKNEKATIAEMKKLLKGVEFRAKRLMINGETPSTLCEVLTSFCMESELKRTDRLVVSLDPESTFPTRTFEMTIPAYMSDQLTGDSSVTHVFSDRFQGAYAIPDVHKQMLGLAAGTYLIARCLFDLAEKEFEKVKAPVVRFIGNHRVKREIKGDLLYRHTITGCGYSMTVIHKSKENTIDWKSVTCGLGILCPNCADPFEWTYFNDIPRRVISEPKWMNVFKVYEGSSNQGIRNFAKVLESHVSMEDLMMIKMPKEAEDRRMEKEVKKEQKNTAKKTPASWTGLPIDIQKKVVEKLDLLTRCRLKISSRSNRKLVNSVPLTIKNARIGLGDNECLLLIHTGIGKFVKLDLEKIRGTVVIKRSINSYNMSNAKTIRTEHTDMFVAALPLMKSLLTSVSNNIHLDVLEWEFNPISNMIFFLIKKLLDGVKFRVKKLLLNHKFTKSTDLLLAEFCLKKDLKEVEKMSVDPGAKCPFPLVVMETCYPNYVMGKTLRILRVKLFMDPFDVLNIRPFEELVHEGQEGVYVTLRLRAGNPKALFAKCSAKPIRLSDKTLIKREYLNPSIIALHRLSPCGYSKTVIHKSRENSVDWESEPCELGVLCDTCNTQFAFGYFNRLPRRVFNELKWTNVFCNFHDERERQEYFAKLKTVVKKGPALEDFDFKNLGPECYRERIHDPILNSLKSQFGLRGPGYPANLDQLAAQVLGAAGFI